MMKKILLSALALGMMSSVAMAEPANKMTDAQMDAVTAGNHNTINQRIRQSNWARVDQTQLCLVCVGVGGSGQYQNASVTQSNRASQRARIDD
jgi:hypothetical protein